MRAVGAAMSFDGMRRPSFSQANVQIAGASELMSPCRPLVRVALKGSKEPMMLFSFEPRRDERKRYFDRFELGVEAYLNGEWEQARALLEGCVNSDPGDRPPAVLLEYMEERDFVAPPTWSGHRELTSK